MKYLITLEIWFFSKRFLVWTATNNWVVRSVLVFRHRFPDSWTKSATRLWWLLAKHPGYYAPGSLSRISIIATFVLKYRFWDTRFDKVFFLKDFLTCQKPYLFVIWQVEVVSSDTNNSERLSLNIAAHLLRCTGASLFRRHLSVCCNCPSPQKMSEFFLCLHIFWASFSDFNTFSVYREGG